MLKCLLYFTEVFAYYIFVYYKCRIDVEVFVYYILPRCLLYFTKVFVYYILPRCLFIIIYRGICLLYFVTFSEAMFVYYILPRWFLLYFVTFVRIDVCLLYFTEVFVDYIFIYYKRRLVLSDCVYLLNFGKKVLFPK